MERRQSNAGRRVSTPILIPLFVVSLAIPLIFEAGLLRLSPYRVILIVLFVPCVMAWLSGRAGKIRLPDILMLLLPIWGTLALTIHHGVAGAWETAGILFIETTGSYLLARWLIRSQEAFRAMVRTFFWLVCALLPFAVIESLTSQALLLDAFASLGDVVQRVMPNPRYGLQRAQVVFEHPILYGVFCASGLGLVYYVLGAGQSFVRRSLRAAIVTAAAIFSLSSGAVISIVAQYGLAGWDRITRFVRRRWRLLAIFCIVAYIVVDLLSNRSPFHVFVSYLTFSPSTGYARIIIWQYGSAEVMRHPLFGIGLGDWQRPAWLGGSMDNFWLVVAVRYGIPAFAFLAGALFVIIRGLARAKIDDAQVRACRAGLLVTLGGLVIAGSTVHFWNAIYVWFMFLMGSGLWILDQPNEPQTSHRREAVTR